MARITRSSVTTDRGLAGLGRTRLGLRKTDLPPTSPGRSQQAATARATSPVTAARPVSV